VICCTTTRLGARSLSGSARHSVIRLWGLAATHVCHVNVSPRSFALTLLTSSRRLSFRCWRKDVFCNSSDVTGGRRGRGRWHGTNGCGHTERLCIASAVSGQRPRVSTIENLNPGKPVLSFMARHDDSEPNPREAQRDGQGAIPPDNPLRELHQEREAANDRPIGSTPAITPARSGGLCDIERDGSTRSHKQPVVPQQRRKTALINRASFAKFARICRRERLRG
jgi:hypothetical protein